MVSLWSEEVKNIQTNEAVNVIDLNSVGMTKLNRQTDQKTSFLSPQKPWNRFSSLFQDRCGLRVNQSTPTSDIKHFKYSYNWSLLRHHGNSTRHPACWWNQANTLKGANDHVFYIKTTGSAALPFYWVTEKAQRIMRGRLKAALVSAPQRFLILQIITNSFLNLPFPFFLWFQNNL